MVVGMDKYFTASEVAFYSRQDLPESPQTASQNLFGGDALMYDWWSPAREQYGRRLLLLSFKQKDLADPRLAPWLKEAGPVQEQGVEKGGRPVLRFYYRVVRYGAPAPEKRYGPVGRWSKKKPLVTAGGAADARIGRWQRKEFRRIVATAASGGAGNNRDAASGEDGLNAVVSLSSCPRTRASSPCLTEIRQ
jgi:hypothetical protein